jgi:hypothetical protein
VKHPKLVPLLVEHVGLTGAEAIDYSMVWLAGKTATDWSASRTVSQQAVSSNVQSAMDKIEDNFDSMCPVLEEVMWALCHNIETELGIEVADEIDVMRVDGSQIFDIRGIDILAIDDMLDDDLSLADGAQTELRSYWRDIIGDGVPTITIANLQGEQNYILRANGFLDRVADL